MYHCLPSDVLRIEDEYAAYCFDEACCYISLKLQEGENPHYVQTKQDAPMEYKNFKDFYRQYEQ